MALIILSSVYPITHANAAISSTVTVTPTEVTGINQLSLGYQIAYEWNTWRSSSALQQLSEDANFKFVRLWSHMIEP